MSKHGSILWSELLTPDAKAAAEYYSKVIGWTVHEMDMGGGEPYRVMMLDDAPQCGIMARSPEMGDAPSAWMTYIGVDDVDKRAAEAGKHGGKVVQPPFDIPTVGRIAMVQDPTGAMVGIMTPTD